MSRTTQREIQTKTFRIDNQYAHNCTCFSVRKTLKSFVYFSILQVGQSA